jgi:hypothetical protein
MALLWGMTNQFIRLTDASQPLKKPGLPPRVSQSAAAPQFPQSRSVIR